MSSSEIRLPASNSHSERTWAALLTAPVPAAIATIAVSGARAAEILHTTLRSIGGRPLAMADKEARYAQWQFHGDAASVEHVVVCRTAVDSFEIHCHGGMEICRSILEQLHALGCEMCDAEASQERFPSIAMASTESAAEPAFLHAVQDEFGPIERAAERALQRAATLKVAAILLDQVQGALSSALRDLASAIAAGDLAQSLERTNSLLQRAVVGLRLVEPWRMTLAGPANAGKSSLTNAIIGTSRVLVHDQPGTTRDAVDTSIVISSWPVILTDTAGVRVAQESVEQQGIDAAWQRWRKSDIGLLVVDAAIGWTDVHSRLLAERPGSTLVVSNKHDLNMDYRLPQGVVRRVSGLGDSPGRVVCVATRATQPGGVAELLQTLGRYLDCHLPPAGSAVPFLPEHAQILGEVRGLLLQGETQPALHCIQHMLRQ